MMKRRTLALFLSLCLLAGCLPAVQAAGWREPGQTVSYAVPGGFLDFDPASGTITDSTPGILEAMIPEEIDGVPVTAIGERAFEFQDQLAAVSIPDTVCDVGSSAFNRCVKLKSITLPEGVTELYGYTFYGCKELEELNLPQNLDISGTCDFVGTAWLEAQTDEFVIVGDGVLVDYNGTQAHVQIPDGVRVISSAFYSNKTVTSVTVPEGVTALYGAFEWARNLTSVTLPEEGLEIIGYDAFSRAKQLTEIQIPASVKTVGDYAFSGTGLRDVLWTETVENWGDGLYMGCDGLTEVTVPGSWREIPRQMFTDCANLKVVHLEEGVQRIGDYAFSCCEALDQITFPKSLVAVGDTCFAMVPWLKAQTSEFVIVGGGVMLDYHGNGGDLVIPEGVVYINECLRDWRHAQYHAQTGEVTASISSIQLPSTLREIGKFAFSGQPITQIVIPDGVTRIGAFGFSQCTQLRSVSIPGGVQVLEYAAFGDCSQLASIQLEEGVREIGDGAFKYCAISELKTPTSLRTIGHSAFVGCQNLTDLRLTQGVETIGGGAFVDTGLKEVTLPATVSQVGKNAFGRTPIQKLTVLNPDCQISPWMLLTDSAYEPDSVPEATIRGYRNSTAEAYAAMYDRLTFVPLSEEPGQSVYDERFLDVRVKHWFREAVIFNYEHNLMNGISDTQFGPDRTVTRGMLVTILYRLAGKPAVTGSSPFRDVASGKYYSEAVAWAAEHGIVQGMGNGRFCPNDPTSRQQIATILYRYFQAQPTQCDLSRFSDQNQIAGWAREAMTWAVSVGLFQGYAGDATLRPTRSASRAEVAQLFMRVVEDLMKE